MIIPPSTKKFGRICAEVDFDPPLLPELVGSVQTLAADVSLDTGGGPGVNVMSWSVRAGVYQFMCGWAINGINNSISEIGINFTGSGVASMWEISASVSGVVRVASTRSIAAFPATSVLPTWTASAVCSGQLEGVLTATTPGTFSIHAKGAIPANVLTGTYGKCLAA